jgi:hypothetical protein
LTTSLSVSDDDIKEHGDIKEQKAVEKYLHVVPMYTQIALSMEVVVAGNARRPVTTTVDDTCINCGCHDHWARGCSQPRRQGAGHMAQTEEEESSLFLAHASLVLRPKGEASEREARASPHTDSTPPFTSSTLLHIDDGSDDDKLEGWYLDSRAPHTT